MTGLARLVAIGLGALALGACTKGAAAPPTTLVADTCIGDINTKPYYGNVPKCAAQLRADAKLLATIDGNGTPRPQAAKHLIARGWEFVGKDDFDMAMRRFNQAWLLDPSNAAIPWGFAVVAWERDRDLTASIRLFTAARNGGIKDTTWIDTDEGTVLCKAGDMTAGTAFLDRALRLRPTNTVAIKARAICAGEVEI